MMRKVKSEKCWGVTNFSSDEWGALGFGDFLDYKPPKRQDGKTDSTDGTDENGFFFRLRRMWMSRRGGKVRSNPFSPFHPFYNPIALGEEGEASKARYNS